MIIYEYVHVCTHARARARVCVCVCVCVCVLGGRGGGREVVSAVTKSYGESVKPICPLENLITFCSRML